MESPRRARTGGAACMTQDCAMREPLMVASSARGAHVRFVFVLVAHAVLAVLAGVSGAVSFGGVLPWRITEWTIAALVASVFIVRFSRCDTGPIFAVADDLLPVITVLAVVLALATLAE